MTLEQPDDDELYCWKVHGTSDEFTGYYAEEEAKAVAKRIGGTAFAFPLYVKPQPPREWVGLTDAVVLAIGKELGLKCKLGGNPNIDFDYAKAIEAALKAKNI
jgi:hypothetical protein